MASAASACKRLPLWTVIGCLLLFSLPLLYTAVKAVANPQPVTASGTDFGTWVINEIHADPAGDPAGDANGDGLSDPLQDEFIELFNNTGTTADISGWALADKFGTRHQFPDGTVVPDRCAIVVFGGGTPADVFGNSVIQVASSGTLGLDDTGDTITLSNGSSDVQSVSYGFEANEDQSLTRNPDIDGEFERHLTASAPLNMRFSPGTRLDSGIFWGCPGYDAPPAVVETQPFDGASAVGINNNITVTFSEPISLNEPWYEIVCTKSSEHTAVTNGSDNSYTLVPDKPFAYSETCQVTIFGSTISDLDGQPQTMEGDVQWQFSTEAEVDSPPQIVDSYPADGTTIIPLNATLSISFSEAVVLAETAVHLSCHDSGDILLQVSGGPLQFQLKTDIELEPGELCTLTVDGEGVSDLDLDDPPDQMTANWRINFSVDVTNLLLINEVDSETPGIDDREFIELFDGGFGQTSLDGLAIVLFSGHDDRAYASFDLDGLQTDEQGFFLLGSSGVAGVDLVMADSLLQNGADAVALYRAEAAAMPVGTDLTTENLIDALVYDTDQAPDNGLLPLLLPGEVQVNENGRDLDDLHSLQRCPNGSGGQRRTGTFWPDFPTPKEVNTCIKDEPPLIIGTTPAGGTSDVPLVSELSISFSEEVNVYDEWFIITCEHSGIHEAAVNSEGLRISLQPSKPFSYGETCAVTIFAELVSDLDSNDPPDHLDTDYSWSFRTIPASHMVINEVDADTPGPDTTEFIELFDGGQGATPLDGLIVVLFNGADDLSYRTIDLSGQITDEGGRFVLGNPAVPGVDFVLPDNSLQNGADAVALYAAKEKDFPNGSTLTTTNLLDALVYGTGDAPDAELLDLLVERQPQVDEDGRDNGDGDSNQRCPDGSGGQRHSDSFIPNLPTPGKANNCAYDFAPSITYSSPDHGAVDVPLDTNISITFSEAVMLDDGSLQLLCTRSGDHDLAVSSGPTAYTFKPNISLSIGETCSVILFGDKVSDLDNNDPPDHMAGDYTWSFETVSIPVPRHMVINEVDADTTGVDTAEFIELFDGGEGHTALDGLEIILFNGADDQAYRRIDLAGFQTGATGYFIIGASTVPGIDVVLPNGVIQNGPDAVALYVREEADEAQPGTVGLLDALVYHTNDEEDSGLQFLLLENEPQVNEGSWRDPALDSNQRCPNGQGGQRTTSGYVQNKPTPGTANNCMIDKPPQISQVIPAAGAVDVALDSSLVVLFDESVQLLEAWIKLSCLSGGIVDLVVSGGSEQYTIQPASLAPFDTCTATVSKDKVFDRDGYADTLSDDYVWHFSTGKPLTGFCGDEATSIHAVQGNGDTSPLVDSTGIIIEGVVIADYQGEQKLGGFFLQEETTDIDGDPLTSEGIFIADGPNTEEVTTGETLRLKGDVAERVGMTQLINITSWQRCGIETAVDPQSLTLPLAENLSWEALEGMLVNFSQKLTVIGNDRWGSAGIVNLANQELFYPTMIANPGPEALEVAESNLKRQITLDDGSQVVKPLPYPPYLGPGNTLRRGDAAETITGVIAEAEDGYRLHPTEPVILNRENPHPALAPVLASRTRVAHVNAGDFFNGDGQGQGFLPGYGAQSVFEYERQREKLVSAILALDAGVIGLTEIENDGYGESSAVQDLVSALNEATEPEQLYQSVEIPGDEQVIFADTAVLIYRQDLVSPSGNPITLAEYPFAKLSRRPLGQRFFSSASGLEITVIVTQFPERDNCPSAGDPNADQGDGQACWNKLRAEAADSLSEWVRQLQAEDGIQILIIGDLNSYAREEPVQALEAAGLANIGPKGTEKIAYSAVLNGEAGLLNYGFVTGGLAAKVAQVQYWHINADEPAALDYRETNQPLLYAPHPYRSAAQDPLVIDLSQTDSSAGFTSNSPVWIGQPVHFTNLSHGPKPLTYEWDFGDGSPLANEADPIHYYEQIGYYNVTLTVKTGSGETGVYNAPVEVLPVYMYLPLARS